MSAPVPADGGDAGQGPGEKAAGVTFPGEAATPPLAWWKLLLILVPCLAVGYYAAAAATIAAAGIPVFILLFGGPLYAAIVLPVIALKWRRGRAALHPSVDEAISQFRRNVQRWHFALMVTLLLNLALAVLVLFTAGAPLGLSGAAFSVVIMFGPIAMVCAVPAVILGVKWALNGGFARNEGAALEKRLGAWRLILAHRIVSWIVWLGYSGAAVLLAIAFVAAERTVG